MSPEQNDNAIYKLAWTVLTAGVLLLATVAALRWYFPPEPPASTAGTAAATGKPGQTVPESAVTRVEQPAAPAMTPRPSPREAGDIPNRDPGVIDRQARWLRKQAAAAENSPAGPRSLTLTEEQIGQLERKNLLLQ